MTYKNNESKQNISGDTSLPRATQEVTRREFFGAMSDILKPHDTPTDKPERNNFQPVIKRRDLPGLLLSVTENSELITQANLLTDDVKKALLPILGIFTSVIGLELPKGSAEYLTQNNSPLTFIPGSHATPESWPMKLPVRYPGEGKTTEQVKKEEAHDDINMSAWPDATMQLIDSRMKAAKKDKRTHEADDTANYRIVVDSVFGQNCAWSWLPHPNPLNPKEDYPEHITIIGAETFYNYTITRMITPANCNDKMYEEIDLLGKEVKNRYDPYASQTVSDVIHTGITTLAGIWIDTLIAQGLVTPSLLQAPLGRRILLEGAILSLTALKITGKLELFGALAGVNSNSQAQKALVELQSVTDETYGSDYLHLWLLARTAWAVEKADYISRKHNNAPIDILYGDAHSDQVPTIMTSREFRITLIKSFMKQHIAFLKDKLTNYPSLSSISDDILYYSTCGLAFYTTAELAVPWGQKTWDGGFCFKDDTYNLSYVPSLYDAAEEMLQQEGVDVKKYHTNKAGIGIDFLMNKAA